MKNMSFLQYKTHVQLGDTLFVYLGIKNIYPIHVKSGEVFQTKYGALRHDDLVGKEYGSVVNCAKGWVHILHSTPDLWTLTLPHRTQILYSTDISLIITELDLKPGCIVCEAGTGSGSLSHAIATTIAPDGHLFTYDFHDERVETAKKEFSNHGLDNVITVRRRDVCTDGFDIEHKADAVFLDLPHPWQAIPYAKMALKGKGSRICTFSPCIEQVQKTCASLRDCQFVDIETVECILRPYEVKQSQLLIYDFSLSQTQSNQEFDNQDNNNDNNRNNSGEKSAKKVKSNNDDILKKDKEKERPFNCAFPLNQIAGHTGYLTFAAIY